MRLQMSAMQAMTSVTTSAASAMEMDDGDGGAEFFGECLFGFGWLRVHVEFGVDHRVSFGWLVLSMRSR